MGFVQATLSTQNGESVAELAWDIASAHQGQGYARHATKAVARWLRKLGANLIIAHVHSYHQASMAVAAGIGMSPSETNVDGEVRWVGRWRGALGRLKPATSSTALVPVTDRVLAISPPS